MTPNSEALAHSHSLSGPSTRPGTLWPICLWAFPNWLSRVPDLHHRGRPPSSPFSLPASPTSPGITSGPLSSSSSCLWPPCYGPCSHHSPQLQQPFQKWPPASAPALWFSVAHKHSVNFQCYPKRSILNSGLANKALQAFPPASSNYLSRPLLTAFRRGAPRVHIPTLLLCPCCSLPLGMLSLLLTVCILPDPGQDN